jgi:hypothetical protein
MPITDILDQIDSQIAALERAKALLSGTAGRTSDRKAKPASGIEPASTTSKPKKKRRLSPEARARIAEAQRKRWAAQKKAK